MLSKLRSPDDCDGGANCRSLVTTNGHLQRWELGRWSVALGQLRHWMLSHTFRHLNVQKGVNINAQLRGGREEV